ncbi:hypothetical protein PQX77_021436 [Marasmius sp. AFHP31]|nr:hypothetical protein PQX77_021436 [Marasmius sp. AFHP31]
MPMRSTPYPRNVLPPTPSIRSTPGAPPNLANPDDDPSNQTEKRNNEEVLCQEISRMAREAIQEQSRVSISQSEVAEDQAKREARKECIAAQLKIRMKDPDTFDGEVWEILKTFFEQCENTYEAKPDIYS